MLLAACCTRASFFVHAAQQFLANDHVETHLLIWIEHRAHLEDVRDGFALGLAHGVVKAVNGLGKAIALRVVLRHGGGDVSGGRAQFSVKRGFTRCVTGFNRLQSPVLFGREIKFAVHRRIECVSMGFGSCERCAHKNASQSCAEPDEQGKSEHLPGLQHVLLAKRRGGSVGLIERKRSGIDRG